MTKRDHLKKIIRKIAGKLKDLVFEALPSWIGVFEITIYNLDTGKLKKKIVFNRVMDVGLNALADTLVGTTPDLEIKYLAVGTDNTLVTDNDAQLGAEIFRTPPVSGPLRTTVGQIETEFILLDSEAVGSLREVAIFVGATATGTANSGVLLSRILWSYEKTNSEEITIKRIDKIVMA